MTWCVCVCVRCFKMFFKAFWPSNLIPITLGLRLVSEIENLTNYKGCWIPVSYTHLDVYKRQVCTLIQVETPVHIFVWAKLAIHNMLISNILLIIYSLLSKFKFLYSMLSTSLICTVALFLCLVTKKNLINLFIIISFYLLLLYLQKKCNK